MKRVMIVGGPGSGMTTLANGLGEITGLRVFHVDHFHSMPDRGERSQPDQTALAEDIQAQDRWISEGGFSKTLAGCAARADNVIWLDLPLSFRFARVLKRRVHNDRMMRPDRPDSCPERLDPGLLAFMYRTRRSGREGIAQMIANAPHLKIHHIRTSKGADTFLEWLQIPRAVGD